MSLVGQELYWYQWRGKRAFVRCKVVHFDKIRKMHKIVTAENHSVQKLNLQREYFFFAVATHTSEDELSRMLSDKDAVNIKKVLSQRTDELLLNRGRELYDFVH